VITKDLIIAKDLRTYSIRILRQEKLLRDHGAGRWGGAWAEWPASLLRLM